VGEGQAMGAETASGNQKTKQKFRDINSEIHI
jgi:hypothetical protein